MPRKGKKHQKRSSFQDEIIALQREQLAAQAQQIQVLDAQNQMEERQREKVRTFLLELGKLFANQK